MTIAIWCSLIAIIIAVWVLCRQKSMSEQEKIIDLTQKPTTPKEELLDCLTVLIVDDDRDILEAIEAYLQSICKARLLRAMDGQTASEVIDQEQPDIVILDIMLPKQSGFIVLDKVRQTHKVGFKPFIIIITGIIGKRHQQYAEALGVESYLHKPFYMESLRDAMVRAVAK